MPEIDQGLGMSARPAYDDIGRDYARYRQADPRFAKHIVVALGDASSVLNVGAGAGSYEPHDRRVVALEPSALMISQRPINGAPAICGVAEALPFAASSFDAVMAVLTIHHWQNRDKGLSELRRVARRRVIFTFDPSVHNQMWLMDYVPQMAQLESAKGIPIGRIFDAVDGRSVAVLPVPFDCLDGMTIANWRHPEAYLDPAVHAGSSSLRQVDQRDLQHGLSRLASDLRTGKWQERYGYLLERTELDCGLRLIVGESVEQ
jgi:SAM-dependent methyltransferase